MQVKKIAALVAVACSAMAGSAHAAMTPAQTTLVNDAVANGRIVFISGASATQKGFTGIVASMSTGTPIRFANTLSSSKDFEAVAGVLAAGSGPWSGQNVIIIDRVKGGSVFGVDPVARNTAIESLKVTLGLRRHWFRHGRYALRLRHDAARRIRRTGCRRLRRRAFPVPVADQHRR